MKHECPLNYKHKILAKHFPDGMKLLQDKVIAKISGRQYGKDLINLRKKK